MMNTLPNPLYLLTFGEPVGQLGIICSTNRNSNTLKAAYNRTSAIQATTTQIPNSEGRTALSESLIIHHPSLADANSNSVINGAHPNPPCQTTSSRYVAGPMTVSSPLAPGDHHQYS
jgi:hypothetical protein